MTAANAAADDASRRLIARDPSTPNDVKPAQLAIGGWAEGLARNLREKMPSSGSKAFGGFGNFGSSRQDADEITAPVQSTEPLPDGVEGVSRKWVSSKLMAAG